MTSIKDLHLTKDGETAKNEAGKTSLRDYPAPNTSTPNTSTSDSSSGSLFTKTPPTQSPEQLRELQDVALENTLKVAELEVRRGKKHAIDQVKHLVFDLVPSNANDLKRKGEHLYLTSKEHGSCVQALILYHLAWEVYLKVHFKVPRAEDVAQWMDELITDISLAVNDITIERQPNGSQMASKLSLDTHSQHQVVEEVSPKTIAIEFGAELVLTLLRHLCRIQEGITMSKTECLFRVGRVYYRSDDYERGVKYLTRAKKCYEKLQTHKSKQYSLCLWFLGSCFYSQERFADCAKLYAESASVAIEIGDTRWGELVNEDLRKTRERIKQSVPSGDDNTSKLKTSTSRDSVARGAHQSYGTSRYSAKKKKKRAINTQKLKFRLIKVIKPSKTKRFQNIFKRSVSIQPMLLYSPDGNICTATILKNKRCKASLDKELKNSWQTETPRICQGDVINVAGKKKYGGIKIEFKCKQILEERTVMITGENNIQKAKSEIVYIELESSGPHVHSIKAMLRNKGVSYIMCAVPGIDFRKDLYIDYQFNAGEPASIKVTREDASSPSSTSQTSPQATHQSEDRPSVIHTHGGDVHVGPRTNYGGPIQTNVPGRMETQNTNCQDAMTIQNPPPQ